MNLSRRELLQRMGAFAAFVLAACGVESQIVASPTSTVQPTVTSTAESQAQASPTAITHVPDCVLTPSQGEGPFYFDADLVRRDITEGKQGVPLRVALRVVNATSCTPIRDAVVDIWQTDATGAYSGYGGQGDSREVDTTGETFMRGFQVTDSEGLAEFDSIYPGWYPGRTIHIHFKVHLDNRTVVTSQMYFPDDVTDMVFTREPYVARGRRNTTNQSDVFLRGDPEELNLLVDVLSEGTGYLASLNIGVAL